MITILVMNSTDSNKDPRPNRVLNFLLSKKDTYSVSLVSEYTFNGIYNFFPLKSKITLFFKILTLFFMKLRFYFLVNHIKFSKILIFNLLKFSFDVIICHDLFLLPLAFKIKKNAKIIFDAREYYSRLFEDQLFWKFFHMRYNKYLIKRYMIKCDHVLTVSPGLVKEYKSEYKIETELYLSLPKYKKTKSSNHNLSDEIMFVHHGNATPSRRIEIMIDSFKNVDHKYQLHLYLMNHNNAYYQFLMTKVKNLKNVKIFEPVPYNLIHQTLIKYDVGIILYNPTGFNVQHCLPNKFFEYIQAGLALCISPNLDMKELVTEYKCGLISNEYSIKSYIDTISGFNEYNINEFKSNSAKASEVLNAEMNEKRLETIFVELGI